MLTKLWADPEIVGRIYLQARMLFADSIARDQKDKLHGIHADVMHKLTAMRYHLEGYRQIEERMYLDHRKAFETDPTSNAECFELIFMFEGFAFQLKSALDMLVKALDIAHLKNSPSTHTYGEKGDGVIACLRSNQEVIRKLLSEGNKTVNPQSVERIEALIVLMEGARDSWLKEAVEIRDGVSHYKAAKEFVFTLAKAADGRIDAIRPVFKRHGKSIEPLPYMERLFGSSVEFCQDFLCHALNIATPYWELSPADPVRALPVAGTQHVQYIKWEWMFRGTIIQGMADTASDE